MGVTASCAVDRVKSYFWSRSDVRNVSSGETTYTEDMKSERQNELEVNFVRIFDSYGPALRRLCGAYRRDPTERQDLLQEIALAVWTSLPHFRGQASERTWVYRIAHNVAITFSAGQKRRDEMEQSFDPTAHDPATKDNSARLMLIDAIQQLKPIDQHLALLYLEGLSGSEISEITGLSPDNIGVRLNRLKQRLASGLDRKETEDEPASRSR
jgi:RNA polymerase sigma-70 factor, ECF subfamily